MSPGREAAVSWRQPPRSPVAPTAPAAPSSTRPLWFGPIGEPGASMTTSAASAVRPPLAWESAC
eukprot:3158818-Pyramimonas_sp.AAC.1